MRKIAHSQRRLIFVCQSNYLMSHQANSDDAGYIVGTASHPCFQNCIGSLGERKNLSQVWNLIMHEPISSSQTSAMEVSLHQPQAGMDRHTNPERCFWTPVLGLCSLASVGVRCLIVVKISCSSICSFTQLAPFRSLAL